MKHKSVKEIHLIINRTILSNGSGRLQVPEQVPDCNCDKTCITYMSRIFMVFLPVYLPQ